MRKVLIICNTFYQLIMAIQLKIMLFNNDNMNLIITEQSSISTEMIKNLEKEKLFYEIYLVETKKFGSRKNTLVGKINDIINISSGRGFSIINSKDVDLLLYYNLDLTALTIFANAYRKNKQLSCARYEEGILSYNNVVYRCAKIRIADFLRQMCGKHTLYLKTSDFYCCYPSVYKGNLRAVMIPKIDIKGQVPTIMKNMFSIKKEQLEYNQKFIYFTSVYDFEGDKPIKELDLVRKIRNLVGNNNLLVKVHPRDTRTIYFDEGFNVDKNSNIPWEAIQLNLTCDKIVFITTNSGSVLSINMMLEPMPQTIFGYKCCDINGNKLAEVTVENIECLLSDEELKANLKNINVISSVFEIQI